MSVHAATTWATDAEDTLNQRRTRLIGDSHAISEVVETCIQVAASDATGAVVLRRIRASTRCATAGARSAPSWRAIVRVVVAAGVVVATPPPPELPPPQATNRLSPTRHAVAWRMSPPDPPFGKGSVLIWAA